MKARGHGCLATKKDLIDLMHLIRREDLVKCIRGQNAPSVLTEAGMQVTGEHKNLAFFRYYLKLRIFKLPSWNTLLWCWVCIIKKPIVSAFTHLELCFSNLPHKPFGSRLCSHIFHRIKVSELSTVFEFCLNGQSTIFHSKETNHLYTIKNYRFRRLLFYKKPKVMNFRHYTRRSSVQSFWLELEPWSLLMWFDWSRDLWSN